MANQGRVVVLESPNPADLTLDELEEVAECVRQRITDTDVGSTEVRVAGDQQFGAGTAFQDIVNVILPNAEFLMDSAYALVLTELVAFARKRFRKPHEENRPRRIDVYNPDGMLARSYVISDATAEPVITSGDTSGPADDSARDDESA